ncbi:hypothetical protein Ddye_028812 [Dipteronia dyeriana]|uniref:Uncharacterized protein n=1 Tax=Dipteronia dyeriana TaxID=168575 RepID=A0AAD9WL19_9ROSI|nr:hypothetical protein Ddye_028812 [Dipteronia dyeriana]
MVDDYRGDSSEISLEQSDASSELTYHDGASIAGPPFDMGVGEMGWDLTGRQSKSKLWATRQGHRKSFRSILRSGVERKDMKSLSKNVSTLISSNLKLKKKVKKTKSDSERLTNESPEKLARAEEELARLVTALESSEKKLFDTNDMLADAFEKLDKAIDNAVIQTSGELMNRYIIGEIDSLRPEKEIEV